MCRSVDSDYPKEVTHRIKVKECIVAINSNNISLHTSVLKTDCSADLFILS